MGLNFSLWCHIVESIARAVECPFPIVKKHFFKVFRIGV